MRGAAREGRPYRDAAPGPEETRGPRGAPPSPPSAECCTRDRSPALCRSRQSGNRARNPRSARGQSHAPISHNRDTGAYPARRSAGWDPRPVRPPARARARSPNAPEPVGRRPSSPAVGDGRPWWSAERPAGGRKWGWPTSVSYAVSRVPGSKCLPGRRSDRIGHLRCRRIKRRGDTVSRACLDGGRWPLPPKP